MMPTTSAPGISTSSDENDSHSSTTLYRQVELLEAQAPRITGAAARAGEHPRCALQLGEAAGTGQRMADAGDKEL